MSTATELETFIQKFHQLWNAGLSAHLDLDCHAGVACVGLRLQLGHPPGPFHHQPVYSCPPHRKTFSPSYQRRRERRSAARANGVNAEKASNLAKTEVINGIDEGAEKVSNKETTGTVATEIEENWDEAKECESKELEETEEVLEENNNEQIAEKADNDVYAIEDENWKSAIEESCVKANNSVAVQTNMGSNSEAEGRHEHDVIVLESKEEGFIGPRLPKVMTDKEFKALMDKHFADKYS